MIILNNFLIAERQLFLSAVAPRVAPVENMVYANQQEYYNAIAASTAEGQSGTFIDFMLNEILKTLQRNVKEEVPNKVPNIVPNKSELSVL